MKKLYIDFETYYNKKEKYDLASISIVEYVNDPQFSIQGYAYRIDDGPILWQSGDTGLSDLVALLNKEDYAVVAHNIKFDGAILAWKYGATPKRWVDTQGLAKAVLGASVQSVGLRFLGEYLGLPPKGQLKTNGLKTLTVQQAKELETYCKRDVEICFLIDKNLSPHLPPAEYQLMDWTIRAFLNPQLTVNGDICRSVYEAAVMDTQSKIKQAGVTESTLASNQQFADWLRDNHYMVPTKTNKNGQTIPALSISDKEFQELYHTADDRLKQVLDARIAVKQTLEQTRSEKLARISDISNYCFDVIYSGAQQTHRFSGGNGCAGNPQNFRRGSNLRQAIGVPDGKSLICADFKNIELRVLAFLSRDITLMNAICNHDDLYCQFASRIYKRTITKEDKVERHVGKAAVLGLGYGMGYNKFANTVYTQTGVELKPDFAKEVVDMYRKTYTGVTRFWYNCEQALDLIYKGKAVEFPQVPFLWLDPEGIKLPSGLKIKYPHLEYKWKKYYGKSRKNWTYERFKSRASQPDKVHIYGGYVTENICQALAGEICKQAIKRLIDYGYPPCGQVHDELLVVCDQKDVKKIEAIVTMAMTAAMPWWPQLPLEIEMGVGKTWLEAK